MTPSGVGLTSDLKIENKKAQNLMLSDVLKEGKNQPEYSTTPDKLMTDDKLDKLMTDDKFRGLDMEEYLMIILG